jgi:hypothetical protein
MSKNRRCPTLVFESEPGLNPRDVSADGVATRFKLDLHIPIIPQPGPEDSVCNAGARGQQEHRQG